MGTKAWEIVAYTYRAENLCPTCVIESMIGNGEASPAAREMREEDVLDQIAAANAIDRDDEHSYDSGEFPKIVYACDVQGDRCDRCDSEL